MAPSWCVECGEPTSGEDVPLCDDCVSVGHTVDEDRTGGGGAAAGGGKERGSPSKADTTSIRKRINVELNPYSSENDWATPLKERGEHDDERSSYTTPETVKRTGDDAGKLDDLDGVSEPKKSLIDAFNSPAKELLAKGGSMVRANASTIEWRLRQQLREARLSEKSLKNEVASFKEKLETTHFATLGGEGGVSCTARGGEVAVMRSEIAHVSGADHHSHSKLGTGSGAMPDTVTLSTTSSMLLSSTTMSLGFGAGKTTGGGGGVDDLRLKDDIIERLERELADANEELQGCKDKLADALRDSTRLRQELATERLNVSSAARDLEAIYGEDKESAMARRIIELEEQARLSHHHCQGLDIEEESELRVRLMSAQQAASSARRERDAMREKLGGEVRKLRTALDEKTEALEIARSEMEAAVEKARQRQFDEDKGMVEEEWRAARMAIDDDSRHCKELEERNAHLLEALSQALAEVDERAREMEVLRSAMKTAEEDASLAVLRVENMEKEEERGRADEEAREEERARYRETIAGLEGKVRQADEARTTSEDEVTQLRAALGGLQELLEGSREEAMGLSETHGAYEGALRSAVESAQELDIALEKAQAITSESALKLIACQNDIIRMRGERAALEASMEALGGECRALKLELGDRDTRVSALEWALEEAQEQVSASDSRALSERDAHQQDQARLREEIEGLRGEVDELGRRERALGERGAYLEEALQRSIAANNAGTGDRDALRTECKEAVERARTAESLVESIRSERDAALGNAQAAAEHSKAADREREEIVQRAVATSCERDAALEAAEVADERMKEAVRDAERARKQVAILEAGREAVLEAREQVERELKGEGGRRERTVLMLRAARAMLADRSMLQLRQKLLRDALSGLRAYSRLSRSLNGRMIRVVKLRRSSAITKGFKVWKDRWNSKVCNCGKIRLHQAAKARKCMHETFFKIRQVCSVLKQIHRRKARAVGTLLRMLVLRSFRTWRAAAGEVAHYRRVVGKVMDMWAKGSLSQCFRRWRDVSIQAKKDRKKIGKVLAIWSNRCVFEIFMRWRGALVDAKEEKERVRVCKEKEEGERLTKAMVEMERRKAVMSEEREAKAKLLVAREKEERVRVEREWREREEKVNSLVVKEREERERERRERQSEREERERELATKVREERERVEREWREREERVEESAVKERKERERVERIAKEREAELCERAKGLKADKDRAVEASERLLASLQAGSSSNSSQQVSLQDLLDMSPTEAFALGRSSQVLPPLIMSSREVSAANSTTSTENNIQQHSNPPRGSIARASHADTFDLASTFDDLVSEEGGTVLSVPGGSAGRCVVRNIDGVDVSSAVSALEGTVSELLSALGGAEEREKRLKGALDVARREAGEKSAHLAVLKAEVSELSELCSGLEAAAGVLEMSVCGACHAVQHGVTEPTWCLPQMPSLSPAGVDADGEFEAALERAAAETLVNRSVLSLVLESVLWGAAAAGIIAAKVMSEGGEEAMSACVSGGGTVLGCLSAWDGGGGADWMMMPGGSNSVVMLKACLESGGTSPSTATSCVIAWVTTGNGWWLGALLVTLMLFIARLAAIYVGWKRPKAAVVAKLTQEGWVLGGDAGSTGKGERAWTLMVSPTPPVSRAGSSIGDMLSIHRLASASSQGGLHRAMSASSQAGRPRLSSVPERITSASSSRTDGVPNFDGLSASGPPITHGSSRRMMSWFFSLLIFVTVASIACALALTGGGGGGGGGVSYPAGGAVSALSLACSAVCDGGSSLIGIVEASSRAQSSKGKVSAMETSLEACKKDVRGRVEDAKKLEGEIRAVSADRDDAVKERDAALKKRDDAAKERDAAVKAARDDAAKERDAAVKAARDDAVKERDAALKEFAKEKDAAIKEKESQARECAKERDSAVKEKKSQARECAKERDSAVKEREGLVKECLKERDSALRSMDGVCNCDGKLNECMREREAEAKSKSDAVLKESIRASVALQQLNATHVALSEAIEANNLYKAMISNVTQQLTECRLCEGELVASKGEIEGFRTSLQGCKGEVEDAVLRLSQCKNDVESAKEGLSVCRNEVMVQAERNPFASVVESIGGSKGDDLSSLTGSCFICAQRLTGTLDQPGLVKKLREGGAECGQEAKRLARIAYKKDYEEQFSAHSRFF